MDLELTQPLTEMSIRNISWGGVKAAGAWGWQPYHLHVPSVLKSESLNLLELSGPVQACNGMAFSRVSPPPSECGCATAQNSCLGRSNTLCPFVMEWERDNQNSTERQCRHTVSIPLRRNSVSYSTWFRRSVAARLLRSWVRIPPGAWMFVCCECFVLSGRGLCDELITRPGESYRLWCVVVCDLEKNPQEKEGHDPRWVAAPQKKQYLIYGQCR